MRVVQRIGDRNGCVQRSGKRKRAVLESSGECRAGDILHHQEDGRIVLADVVERADIRMRDTSDGASLVAESLDSAPRRRRQLAREQLDCYGAIEPRVASPVHLTHSPGTQRGKDFEWAEASARVEPQWSSRRR